MENLSQYTDAFFPYLLLALTMCAAFCLLVRNPKSERKNGLLGNQLPIEHLTQKPFPERQRTKKDKA